MARPAGSSVITDRQHAALAAIVGEANLASVFADVGDLARRLERFAEHYERKTAALDRGALPLPAVSVDAVIAEFRKNPYRVQVLLQAMAFLCTPELLTLVWMSDMGCTIERLAVDYRRHAHVVMEIELRLLDGSMLAFRSEEVWDLAALRFVGLAKADERPEMSGFYPMLVPPMKAG